MEQDVWTLATGEAADRFAQARRKGRPRWLWPDVPVPIWKTALRRLEDLTMLLVAEGEPRGGARRPVLKARNDAEGRAIAVACYTSGLGPWLGFHAEAGVLQTDERTGPLLAAHLDHGRERWRRLEAELDGVTGVLSESGIGVTVVKGAHAARRLYADPGVRPMADLDLLVPAEGLRDAERALADAGHVLERRLRSPPRSEWRPVDSPSELRSLLLVHRGDPYGIDLHASLDIDFFGVHTVRFGEPAAADLEASPWLADGASVLRQPLLAAHHAVHASQGLHGLTLLRLLELVLMLRHDMRAAEDWTALQERLRRHEALGFAYPAFALASRLAAGTIPASFLEASALEAPPRLRRVVDGMRPADAQRLEGLAIEERFMWGRSLRDHGRRVLHMLRPPGRSPRSLAALYAERTWRLLRGRVHWRATAGR